VYAELLATMQRDPGVVPAAVDLIFVARNLERIGDHATNIAVDVVQVARAGSKVHPQPVVGVRDDPHLLRSTSHPSDLFPSGRRSAPRRSLPRRFRPRPHVRVVGSKVRSRVCTAGGMASSKRTSA
jgi:hypothetical protein